MSGRSSWHHVRVARRAAAMAVGTLLMASCGGDSSPDDARVDDSGVAGGAGAVPPIAPFGHDYELIGSHGVAQIRRGESRVVALSATSVGNIGGSWSLRSSLVSMPTGVAATVGPPPMVDLTVDRIAMFEVELTVAPDAPLSADVGSGLYEVAIAPLDDDAPSNVLTSASVTVEVVPAGTPIGPVAMSDYVAVPAAGVTFDVLSNDRPGDAPLDAGSLTIALVRGSGDLTVTASGEMQYGPGESGEELAEYRICDMAGLCSEAQLWVWRELPGEGPGG